MGALWRPGPVFMCESHLLAQSPRKQGMNRQCHDDHPSVCRRARTPPARAPSPAPAPAQGSARACGCEEDNKKQYLRPISCVRLPPLMPGVSCILLNGVQTVFTCAGGRAGQGISKCTCLSSRSLRLLLSPSPPGFRAATQL